MERFKFPQYLRSQGITLFFTQSVKNVPGTILVKDNKGYNTYGHLRELIENPNINWEHSLEETNMIYGKVERHLSLEGKASLNQFGVSISGGLNRVKTVDFEIEDIKAREFNSLSRMKLVNLIMKLRKEDRSTWRKNLNGKFIVVSTFHAVKTTFNFEKEGSFNVRGEIESNVEVGGSAEVSWKSNRSFQVANNQSVPFGFIGFQV